MIFLAMELNDVTFKFIYELHYDSIYKFLRLYSKDSTQIEDVIQDVFIKLWEDKDHVEITYIKTYLFHSARNRMLNLLRNQNQRLRLLENWFEEQTLQSQHSNCFDIDSFYTNALKAIDSLPPKCNEIFLLSRQNNMTYKQIASHKDISIKTVENQMGIALKKIRDYLNTHPFILLTLLFLKKIY